MQTCQAQEQLHLRVTDKQYTGSFSVNLTQSRDILKEGTSFEKMSPPDRPVGKSVVHFFH